MEIRFIIQDREFACDLSEPLEISIPLDFKGDQPNTYNVAKAYSETFRSEEFTGDTREGGGCNFEIYTLIPHCNGTHTECTGHISLERISVENTLREILFPATLITVEPEKSTDTADTYIPEKEENDLLITEKILKKSLADTGGYSSEALIIRTLPNREDKKSRNYMDNQPPYFSTEAMKYLVEKNIRHLLIDVPSVDRTFDRGKLTSHHIFWNVPPGSNEVNADEHSMRTITEMVFIPDDITDGKYLLNIQIPAFKTDAAPSRIFIYKLKK
ncbi:MAG: cyclase family protein [Bacteroidetes bacterium]|nr:cyclase family protein [Bacteroidota bacterium]